MHVDRIIDDIFPSKGTIGGWVQLAMQDEADFFYFLKSYSCIFFSVFTHKEIWDPRS